MSISNMGEDNKLISIIIEFIDEYNSSAPKFYLKWFNEIGIKKYDYISDLTFYNSDEFLDFLDYHLYLLNECKNQYALNNEEIIGYQIADTLSAICQFSLPEDCIDNT